MSKILLVTQDPSNFSSMVTAIESLGATVSWAISSDEALTTVCRETVDLVVVDEELGDMPGLAFVEKVVSINAMINCALVSSLSGKAYHDASEGLGILMRIPPNPQKEDAQRLMAHLNQILGFTKHTKR